MLQRHHFVICGLAVLAVAAIVVSNAATGKLTQHFERSTPWRKIVH